MHRTKQKTKVRLRDCREHEENAENRDRAQRTGQATEESMARLPKIG